MQLRLRRRCPALASRNASRTTNNSLMTAVGSSPAYYGEDVLAADNRLMELTDGHCGERSVPAFDAHPRSGVLPEEGRSVLVAVVRSSLASIMRKLLIVLFVAAFFVAGCSVSVGNKSESKQTPASSPSVSESPEPPANVGITITGEGFTFSAPEGWQDVQAKLGDRFTAAAAKNGDTDGFADNVNVLHVADSGITLDQVKTAAPAELEGVKATNIKILDDIELDGVAAAQVRAQIPVPNKTDLTSYMTQYYVVKDGGHYVITVSSNLPQDDAEATADRDVILNTWKWQ